MPGHWTAERSEKLLAAIVNISQQKLDCNALAEFMGDGNTAFAIEHRLRKLKKDHQQAAPGAAVTKVRKPTKGKGKKASAPNGKIESDQKDTGDGDKSAEGVESVDLVKSEDGDDDDD